MACYIVACKSNQQVLSKSVGEAFAYYGDTDTTETERFVRIFNKFFEIMNTRYLEEDILKLNCDFGARKTTDPRLQVTMQLCLIMLQWPALCQ